MTYQAAYEAFGRHGDTASSEEWGSTLDRQKANTKDEDPTGLLNEGFRYRDLETVTFITRDPLGFVDGTNVYTYVVQNPWTMFDPLGLSMWETGSFLGDVGQVWIGYGRAAQGTVVGLYEMASHPIQTAKGIGYAITHPVEIGKSVIADYGQKLQTNAGQGEILGEVLIGVMSGGSIKTADKAGDISRLARIANKANDLGGNSATATQRISQELVEQVNHVTRPKGVPENWIESPSKKGNGVKYSNPDNSHESVRVMPGNPNSPNPAQQQPYVKQMRDGSAVDADGNRVSPNSEKAHTPADQFEYRPPVENEKP